MARIYFIYTNIYSVYDAERLPFGVASISSVLKQGGHQTGFSPIGEYKQVGGIIKELEDFRTDIVAFTSTSGL